MKGFIALVSTLVLSAILLAIVLGERGSAVLSRFDTLDRVAKAQSDALARSCVLVARVKRLADPAYAGGETISDDTGACAIGSIEDRYDVATFSASARYRGATTALLVSLSDDDDSILSLREIPSSGD